MTAWWQDRTSSNMAVALGNITAMTAGKTCAITCVAGDTLVVAATSTNTNADNATAKYNGVSMTEAIRSQGTQHNAYIFYLINPSVGSHTVTITWSDGSGFYATGAYEMLNTYLPSPLDVHLPHQTLGTGANVLDPTSGDPNQLCLPTVNGNMVVDCMSAAATGGNFATSGASLTYTQDVTSGNSRGAASGYLAQVEAKALTMSYSGQNIGTGSSYCACDFIAYLPSSALLLELT